jgi:AhpD family alkylhydroperoxidase
MQPRVAYEDFTKTAAAAYAGLGTLTKAVDESGLDKSLTELVKLRASQINGCAFCVSFHLNLLRKLGAAREKIDLLPVWREAGVYSQRELAALAWAEIMTGLSPGGASDEAYAALLSAFSVEEATFLNVAIATINAWNRLGVALRFAPLTLRAPSPPRPVDA